ncbi:LPXTG cell wall anchor domain-containing protein, partial [Actinotignum sanguinis]|uniref:LPXTG cell wall anchor domain-containing protein n=2 Tax=Actinotignum sanguinis TaxID=1445614 RepID=UPI002A829FA9
DPSNPDQRPAPQQPGTPATPEQKAPAVKVKRPAAKLAHTGTAVTTGIAGAAALILGGYVLRRKYRG